MRLLQQATPTTLGLLQQIRNCYAGAWTRSRLGLLPPATPATLGRGSLDAWLARLGLGSAVNTPARRDLQVTPSTRSL